MHFALHVLALAALFASASALLCALYEDEFEPNPGTISADGNRSFINAPMLLPMLEWSNNVNLVANTSRLYLTGLQLCSSDADGGVDAFQFRVGRDTTNSFPRGLIRVYVQSVSRQLDIRLRVFKADANVSKLTLVADSLFEADTKDLVFSTDLARIEDEGSLFLVVLDTAKLRNADATAYILEISLPDPAQACAAQKARLADGAPVVSAVPPGRQSYSDLYTVSPCADRRYDFPSNWFDANGSALLFAREEYPFFPRYAKAGLGFMPGATGVCCSIVSASEQVSGNSDLVLNATDFPAVKRNGKSSGQLQYLSGRGPMIAMFYAATCSLADSQNADVSASVGPDWQSTNFFPNSSICALTRKFRIPLAGITNNNSLALWIKAERDDAWRLGSPAISQVTFERADSSSSSVRTNVSSKSVRMLNAVIIPPSTLQAALVDKAAFAIVHISRINWLHTALKVPPMFDVSVSYWLQAPLSYVCSSLNETAGFDIAAFVLCPGETVTTTIRFDETYASGYDLSIGGEVLPTALSPANRVSALLGASVPSLSLLWGGIAPLEFDGTASLTLPLSVFRPFGDGIDIAVQLRNPNGLPVTVRYFSRKDLCIEDSFQNDEIRFNTRPFDMPVVPASGPRSELVSATVCGTRGKAFFQFPINGADLIEVRAYFEALDTNVVASAARGQPQEYFFYVLQLAVVDASQNVAAIDDNIKSLADWGRSVVVLTRNLSPKPANNVLFARIENTYSISAKFKLQVIWRNFSSTVDGFKVQSFDNPTTNVTTGVRTTASTTGQELLVSVDSALDDGGSALVIIGAVIAAVVVFLMLCGIVAFCLLSRKRSWGLNRAELVDYANTDGRDYGRLGPSDPNSPSSGYAATGSLFQPSPGELSHYKPMSLSGTAPPENPKGELSHYGAMSDSKSASPLNPPASRFTKNGSPMHPHDVWSIRYDELVLDQEIGRGAFGTVYRGRWRSTPVAVKQVAEHAMTEKSLAEFFSESQLMKDLRPHANVVLLLGVCESPLCLVTEFLAKGSLSDYLNNPGNIMTPEQRHGTMLGIARGVLHLHIEGIIHRDLAARNVLLTASLEPKIADFGLSRIDDGADNRTVSEVGPLKWMSPENIIQRTFSTKSDVWSFGVTLVELFTRDRPYPGQDGLSVAALVSSGSLTPDLPTQAPEAVRDILLNCWQFYPQARPDMAAIVTAVEAIPPHSC